MTDDDIDRAIRLHEGDSLPGFPSPDTFEFLALPHLQQLAIPSVECVHDVSSALDVLAQRMAHAVPPGSERHTHGGAEVPEVPEDGGGGLDHDPEHHSGRGADVHGWQPMERPMD